ncbi:long-chain-fatty-acid-CoA ligase [Streptomyces hygroscopicus subsp. jinggangensis TL01]|nr:long-chain-fatty-acid-CoA ligase [Streptomyces hygroscopicus subsp. jinggangensis TL01]
MVEDDVRQTAHRRRRRQRRVGELAQPRSPCSRLSDVGPRTAQRRESYPTRSVCGRGAETEQTSRSAGTVTPKCPHTG